MIYALLAEGFEEIEALTVVDILRRAEIPVKTVSVTNEKTVMGGHGISVVADICIGEATVADMLFLPGGMPGVTNLEKTENVIQMIRKHAEQNKYLAAICAAPSIYGKMGLLSGKKAVCYPGFESYLEGAEVLQEPVVQDGKFITSRGAGTAAELGFAIVALFKNKELADKLKSGMIYE